MNNNITPWLKISKRSSLVLAAGFALATVATSRGQTELLDLKASNYNNTTGVWSDPTTGDSATGPVGLLVGSSTPNGSSAVGFAGTNSDGFALGTFAIPLTGGSIFTIFVFAEPTVYTYGAFISGGDNSLEYRINSNGTQTVNRTSEAGDGTSSTALTLGAYNNINVQETIGSGSGSFRINGVDDGATSGDGSISGSMGFIGTQDNGTEPFEGNIAEIEVYSGAMTDTQRAAVEANFTAEYVTAAVPEPSTWAMAFFGVGALLGIQRLRMRKA